MARKEQSSSRFLAHASLLTEAQLTKQPLRIAFITLTQTLLRAQSSAFNAQVMAFQ